MSPPKEKKIKTSLLVNPSISIKTNINSEKLVDAKLNQVFVRTSLQLVTVHMETDASSLMELMS